MTSNEERTYFTGGSIVWGVESTDKLSAIREIVQKSQVLRDVPGLDPARFAEVVIERERQGSTGFGHGVAVAHGRTPEVATTQITLGVSRAGIEYNALDGEPVQLLFIVANHPDQQMDYLMVLSSLVSLVRNPEFRRELLDCWSVDDLEAKLCASFTAALNASKHRAKLARTA
jgi:PTS system nitrogen regulatory IIA component